MRIGPWGVHRVPRQAMGGTAVLHRALGVTPPPPHHLENHACDLIVPARVYSLLDFILHTLAFVYCCISLHVVQRPTLFIFPCLVVSWMKLIF